MPDPNSMAPKSVNGQDDPPTPEDVATLYSWANLHGAKYRDFSSSRAEAREQARLRAEEAHAAEQRRLEEEEERRRQEEAQIAARLAAEAAEAARQAEAERLAEIARQAEAERQAVLAAQEAQRQAALQRAWQPPPAEAYQPGYPTSFASPDQNPDRFAAPVLPVERPLASFNPPGSSYETPAVTSQYATSLAAERELHPYASTHAPQSGSPQPFTQAPAPRTAPASYAEPYRPASSGGSAAQPLQREPAQYPSFQPQPAASPYQQTNYQAAAYPLADPYSPSTWATPEVREAVSRPAWLAPEFHEQPAPAPSGPQPGRLQNPAPYPAMNQPARGAQNPPAAAAQPQTPISAQGQMPMYHQNFRPAGGQMAYSGRGPGQSTTPNPGPADDNLGASRDRIANRWYALKSVFDPQSATVEQVPAQPPARVPVLAVFSLAGGVGKTSLVASLGRALSSRGERVLLVDTAVYGLLPFFFGARDQRPGMLRTFNPPGVSAEAPIQLVTLDPDGQPPEAQNQDANQNPNQPRNADGSQDWLASEVTRYSRGANRVLIDLPTASGSTTRRILRLNPVVLVPVSPDMNSVVSVGAIEAFFRNNGSGPHAGGKQIMPYYVLNQFDYNLPLHLDVREILRDQIGDRLLPFALRSSPAVSEALAEGMTVIDYAPTATVAEDYAHLAEWVRSLSGPATQSYRGVRWSER